MTPEHLVGRVLKPALFALCLLPLAGLLWGAFGGDLGANPVETITHTTGDWALRLLLVTLAVTPLRKLTGWHLLMRLRRMLGLFSFFYALLHFSTYAILDASLDPAYIAEDVLKRPYITVGFTAFVLLIPLAVTSTNAMVRRLGGRTWRLLHRAVYVIGGLSVLHFLWLLRLPAVARRLPALRGGLRSERAAAAR